jgi:hypothetical protein
MHEPIKTTLTQAALRAQRGRGGVGRAGLHAYHPPTSRPSGFPPADSHRRDLAPTAQRPRRACWERRAAPRLQHPSTKGCRRPLIAIKPRQSGVGGPVRARARQALLHARQAESGSSPRYRPTARSRYSRAAASGSIFDASRPAIPATGRGYSPSEVPSTSSRLEAGSVDTISSPRPRATSATAVAQASVVLPMPPFPVKYRTRVGASISSDRVLISRPLPRRSSPLSRRRRCHRERHAASRDRHTRPAGEL